MCERVLLSQVIVRHNDPRVVSSYEVRGVPPAQEREEANEELRRLRRSGGAPVANGPSARGPLCNTKRWGCVCKCGRARVGATV